MFSLLALILCAAIANAAEIVINSVSGDDVELDGQLTVAGAVVKPGQTVKTGENSKCTIELPDGSIISLDENSEVTFVSFTDQNGVTRTVLKVASGNVSASMDLARGSSLTIQTATTEVTGRSGTVCVSVADGTTTVVATEGSVSVTNTADGSVAVIGAGQAVTSSADSTGISSRAASPAEVAAANELAGTPSTTTTSVSGTQSGDAVPTGTVNIEGVDVNTHIWVNSPVLD
ncbi:MAG: FecR family protein [Opitutae bacterium]|nr:FecR family protein [Opitutae bacterium]MCD8298563.1 FecR family protein [Opitutae bacterium]